MTNNSFKASLIFWLVPVAILAVWFFKSIFLIFFIAVVLGSAIQVWALWLKSKFKLPFLINVLIIYLILVVLLVWSLYYLIPIIFSEIKNIQPNLDLFLTELSSNFKIQDHTIDLFKSVFQNLPRFNFGLVIKNIFDGVISAILIFILSFYVATQQHLSSQIINFLPIKNRPRVESLWRRIRKKFSFWFAGQVFLMLIIGLVVYLLMTILKVPNAILIGVIAGLTEIIPVLGPIIAASLALVITLATKFEVVFLVLIGFFVIQELENKFLVPVVMKKAVAISPVFTLLGILIGARVGGILGMLAILPLIVLLVEIYREINPDSDNHKI
ncbi:MAG: AI-2E family transporter [Patescibacteria group bacterium]|nr:AI-2E family transporter [Patescibacteria group bacterium]MCL5257953.1 AI-2E family transporter [Patescibacteria group bacterium]